MNVGDKVRITTNIGADRFNGVLGVIVNFEFFAKGKTYYSDVHVTGRRIGVQGDGDPFTRYPDNTMYMQAGEMVREPGFEPEIPESQSGVLPTTLLSDMEPPVGLEPTTP